MNVHCVMRILTVLNPETEEAEEIDSLQAIFQDPTDADKYIKKHDKNTQAQMHVQMWNVQ